MAAMRHRTGLLTVSLTVAGLLEESPVNRGKIMAPEEGLGLTSSKFPDKLE